MKRVSESVMFKHRGLIGVVFLFPLGLAVIFSSPLIAENSVTDIITDILGWFFFGIYITFRIWSTLYVGGRKDKELQTQGPYSVTRNPLYFGTFCFALSISFFLESMSLAVSTMLIITIYSRWVIAAEEQVLLGIFGDTYSNYLKNTPRFIPGFTHYQTPDFVQVNLKALRTEVKRLWFAALLPVIIERVMYIRAVPWWPHWFILP